MKFEIRKLDEKFILDMNEETVFHSTSVDEITDKIAEYLLVRYSDKVDVEIAKDAKFSVKEKRKPIALVEDEELEGGFSLTKEAIPVYHGSLTRQKAEEVFDKIMEKHLPKKNAYTPVHTHDYKKLAKKARKIIRASNKFISRAEMLRKLNMGNNTTARNKLFKEIDKNLWGIRKEMHGSHPKYCSKGCWAIIKKKTPKKAMSEEHKEKLRKAALKRWSSKKTKTKKKRGWPKGRKRTQANKDAISRGMRKKKVIKEVIKHPEVGKPVVDGRGAHFKWLWARTNALMKEFGYTMPKARQMARDEWCKKKGLKVRARFPKISRVTEQTEKFLIDILEKVIHEGGRMNQAQDGLLLGLETGKQWSEFVASFMMNSKKVAEYFCVPNKFVVEKVIGTWEIIRYDR